MSKKPRVALLIDAENNINPQKLHSLMSTLDATGTKIEKRAIGNWTQNQVSNRIDWKRYGITTIDQTKHRPGKNGADFRLVIEAMEMLHDPELNIDIFVVMSSDHGFIPLYQYLQQQGKKVVVAGDSSLNKNDIKAITDRIIVLDSAKSRNKPNVAEQTKKNAKQTKKLNAAEPTKMNIRKSRGAGKKLTEPQRYSMSPKQRNRTRQLIRKSLTHLHKNKRKPTLDRMYRTMRELQPDFKVRRLGYARLYDLIKTFPEIVTIVHEGNAKPVVRFGRDAIPPKNPKKRRKRK